MAERCIPRLIAGQAGYDGYKRRRRSTVHIAVDTPGHLPAVHVAPAKEQERALLRLSAEAVKAATGVTMELAFVDTKYTGKAATEAAEAHGIAQEVVKLSEAKHGFILLPLPWVVERSFAW